jgi:hypothetical protein
LRSVDFLRESDMWNFERTLNFEGKPIKFWEDKGWLFEGKWHVKFWEDLKFWGETDQVLRWHLTFDEPNYPFFSPSCHSIATIVRRAPIQAESRNHFGCAPRQAHSLCGISFGHWAQSHHPRERPRWPVSDFQSFLQERSGRFKFWRLIASEIHLLPWVKFVNKDHGDIILSFSMCIGGRISEHSINLEKSIPCGRLLSLQLSRGIFRSRRSRVIILDL